MWECASIKAGITVLPERSTRRAPAGTVTSPRRPTATNLLFSITKAEFSIGVLPSPVISRAPSKTVIAAGVWLRASPAPHTVTKHPRTAAAAAIRRVARKFNRLEQTSSARPYERRVIAGSSRRSRKVCLSPRLFPRFFWGAEPPAPCDGFAPHLTSNLLPIPKGGLVQSHCTESKKSGFREPLDAKKQRT